MAQQTFRSHYDKRFAPRSERLPVQTMEILRRCGRVNDLQVVIRRETQETLEARAGMFGALSLEAMRQQQNHPAEPLPFLLRAGDKLVHDGLGGIPEISILRFPNHQAVRAVQAVAVL